MSANPAPSPSEWGALPPSSDWGGAVQPSPAYTDWGGPSPSAPSPSRGGRFGGRPTVFLVVLLVVALMGGSLFYLHMRSSRLPANPTVALSLTFAKGDVRHYKTTIAYKGIMTVAHNQIPFEVTMRGTMLWRVVKVGPHGVASVYVALTGTLTNNAATRPMPSNWMVIRVAPDGRVLSSCTFGGPGPAWIGSLGIPGSTELAPVLPPDGSTSADVSWASQFGQTFPGGKNPIGFETTNTYVRSQQIGGVSAAVVTTRATVPLNLTVDLRELLAHYHTPAGFLGHYHPVLHYRGSIDTALTSWIDQAKRLILRQSSTSKFNVVFTDSNVPRFNRIPRGGLRFQGTESFSMTLLNASHGGGGGSNSNW